MTLVPHTIMFVSGTRFKNGCVFSFRGAPRIPSKKNPDSAYVLVTKYIYDNSMKSMTFLRVFQNPD